MGYGSNDAVQDAEQNHREYMNDLVLTKAAELVLGGMPREEAKNAALEHYKKVEEAGGDVTGTVEANLKDPAEGMPPVSNPAQVAAIKKSMNDSGFDVSDNF